MKPNLHRVFTSHSQLDTLTAIFADEAGIAPLIFLRLILSRYYPVDTYYG